MLTPKYTIVQVFYYDEDDRRMEFGRREICYCATIKNAEIVAKAMAKNYHGYDFTPDDDLYVYAGFYIIPTEETVKNNNFDYVEYDYVKKEGSKVTHTMKKEPWRVHDGYFSGNEDYFIINEY